MDEHEKAAEQQSAGVPSAVDARSVVKNAVALSKPQFRLGLIVGTAVTIAVVLLIVQNDESAQIDWLFFHFSSPLWIILLLTMVAGGVVSEIVKVTLRHGRARSELRRETLKQAKALSARSAATKP